MKYSTVAILTLDDKSWPGYNSCNYFKYSVITHCAALHLLRANEQAHDFLKMLRSAHNEILKLKPGGRTDRHTYRCPHDINFKKPGALNNGFIAAHSYSKN